MVKNKKTVYKIIEKIPADSMISFSFSQLIEFEDRLKEEVINYFLKHKEKTKESHRAILALRWIQGIIRLKNMSDVKGSQKG